MVNSFEYLIARIEANRESITDIRRRLAVTSAKLSKVTSILKGQFTSTKNDNLDSCDISN